METDRSRRNCKRLSNSVLTTRNKRAFMKDLEELSKYLRQIFRVTAIYRCGTPRRDGEMYQPRLTQPRRPV